MSGTTKGEWLVPFKGRNFSGYSAQNFVWREGSVYVMDNHRAALWCWLQHIEAEKPHSIFHIDQHYDTLQSNLERWMRNLPKTWDMTIGEYLNYSYEHAAGEHSKLFTWDNYLSIYLECFGPAIDRCYFATHHVGDKPNRSEVLEVDLWDLPGNMDYWLSQQKPWILNIDLDYFFWDNTEHVDVMVSDAFLERCFEPVQRKITDGTIAVTTICLTPDEGLTGGWGPAEQLATRVLHILGIEFRLP